MDKNPPANAGDTESKIPRALGQLSQCATTTEPVCPELVLCNKRSHHNKKPAQHNREQTLLTATREEPSQSNKDPAQPTINKQKLSWPLTKK